MGRGPAEAVDRGRALARELGTEPRPSRTSRPPNAPCGAKPAIPTPKSSSPGPTEPASTELLPHLPEFTAQARTTSELHGSALYGSTMLAPFTRVPGAVTSAPSKRGLHQHVARAWNKS
ncbi:hypothetical protein AB0I84_13575 [Streptomyces spectabilis]|uniref:hypothetical protein n=1 Tax=Streptomyces spectabilis TaxID=68270 RepID=UPI0033EE243A